jgi:phage tail sheath protein FI
MAFNIGINVVEVDGSAAPTVVAAPVSVAGLLVRSQRGVPNQAVNLHGFTDFVANFGGFIESAFGAHAVRGFFDNGGTEAYAVRIVGSGSRAASVLLNDRLAAATLNVVAGNHGRQDPGEWGNRLAVTVTDHPRATSAIPAQIIGANAEPFALSDGQSIVITVNGGSTPVTLTFNTGAFANIGAASAEEVAATINRQTAILRAGVTPNRRVILVSATPGPSSRLTVADGAITGAAAALGFTGGTANSNTALTGGTTAAALQSVGGLLRGSAIAVETRGRIIASGAMAAAMPDQARIDVTVDGGLAKPIVFGAGDFVNGLGAITTGEVVAAINRQADGFTAALTADNRLILMSNTFGASSTIAIAAPPGPPPPNAIPVLGFAGGDLPVAGTRQLRALDTVIENYKLITWTNGLSGFTPTNVARVQSVEFDVVVTQNGAEVERFESLSMQNTLDYYAPAVINDQVSGSRFITVTDQASASGVGQNAPATGTFALGATAATAGIDNNSPVDIDYIGDPAPRTGLYAFDTVKVQLLACPETTSPGVVTAALAYAENRGDMMFVGSAPRGLDLDGIKTYASAFRGRKVYGALYAPWIQVVNPLDTSGANPRLDIPPTGHVLGVYARIADTRGVWKAPAGDEALLRNAVGVEFDMTDTDHTDLVKNGSVNGIRAIPGSGIIVDASRTLSTDTRWTFVNVRRLFNYVKSSLRDGLRFVRQEPHSEELRRMVKFNVVTPFLLGLWRQGAFGSDPPDKVFSVICDATNNPPSEVNLGNFKIEVYFYPVKPAETIIIVVGQKESGATASEP